MDIPALGNKMITQKWNAKIIPDGKFSKLLNHLII